MKPSSWVTLGASLWTLSCSALSCATLADGEAGQDNAPSSRAGPFRVLGTGELGEGRAAPFALSDNRRLRDPSIVDDDTDPTTPGVVGYFTADREDGSAEIVSAAAPDGRTFAHDFVSVLSASHPWEGLSVRSPGAVIERDGRLSVYYAADGGIGVARSEPGTPLLSGSAPMLDQATLAYADGPPNSPSVVRLPDGSFRMFFSVLRGGKSVIGQAASSDGRVWFADPEPLIVAGPEGSVDDQGVSAPSAVVAESAGGRGILYVYYLTRSSDQKERIGMAARFLGDEAENPFEKNPAVMYAPLSGLLLDEPCVFRYDVYTLLFANQLPSKASSDLGVIVGISPATMRLTNP